MDNKKFQIGFDLKELLAFFFLMLVSFVVIFLLGYTLAKKNTFSEETNFFENKGIKIETEYPSVKDDVVKNQKKELETKEKQPQNSKQETVSQKTLLDKELLAENKYVLQIAAFKNKNVAEQIQKKLKDEFFPAYIKESVVKGEIYYRVRIGSYSLKKAIKVREQVQKKFSQFKDPKIIKIN